MNELLEIYHSLKNDFAKYKAQMSEQDQKAFEAKLNLLEQKAKAQNIDLNKPYTHTENTHHQRVVLERKDIPSVLKPAMYEQLEKKGDLGSDQELYDIIQSINKNVGRGIRLEQIQAEIQTKWPKLDLDSLPLPIVTGGPNPPIPVSYKQNIRLTKGEDFKVGPVTLLFREPIELGYEFTFTPPNASQVNVPEGFQTSLSDLLAQALASPSLSVDHTTKTVEACMEANFWKLTLYKGEFLEITAEGTIALKQELNASLNTVLSATLALKATFMTDQLKAMLQYRLPLLAGWTIGVTKAPYVSGKIELAINLISLRDLITKKAKDLAQKALQKIEQDQIQRMVKVMDKLDDMPLPNKPFLTIDDINKGKSISKSMMDESVLAREAFEKQAKKEFREEIGEKVVKKVGLKLAGKVVLKFIPIVNVVSTIYDLYEIGSELYAWWSSQSPGPSVPTEPFYNPYEGRIDNVYVKPPVDPSLIKPEPYKPPQHFIGPSKQK